MRDFLLVIVYLGAGVEMSTGTFVRLFPKWTNASKITVICDTSKIAQYCETGQSCPNVTKPGVSLEKDGLYPTLTITNRTYDSWSCEAHGYIDDNEQTDNFTVGSFSNQHTRTSPSPGTTGTSSSPGNDESISGTIAAGVSVPIICLVVLLMIILYILYRKVECFKQAIRDFFCHQQAIRDFFCHQQAIRDRFCHQQPTNRNPNEEDIEMADRFLQTG